MHDTDPTSTSLFSPAVKLSCEVDVSMTRGVGLVVLVVLATLWTTTNTQLSAEEPSGVLEIGGEQASVDIPTRVGCREVIRCLGNGSLDSLEWRKFGLRNALQTEGNIMVEIMRGMDPDMDGIFSHVGHLVFDPVTLTDSNSFICTVDDSQGTYTANVRVQAGLAGIATINHDLSVRTVGDEMSIPCTVDSCVPELIVQLLRDNVVQATKSVQQVLSPEFMPREDIFTLTVSQSIVGRYNCRVVGFFMDEPFTVNEYFNITGNPQPRPTPAGPSSSRPGGGGGSNNRGSASKLHTSLAITLVAALLLLPLLLL